MSKGITRKSSLFRRDRTAIETAVSTREPTPEFRALRPEEREACLDLWCAVWPGENSRGYFRRYFYGDVEWLPYYTQVAVLGGRPVSAVHICRRTVACGDFRLTMGGIANVATLPEYRGKGYNSACLQRAIAVMEADAMDFSLLFTGINAYYERQGYAILPRERLRGVIRTEFTPRASVTTVRPATDADLPAIRALYAVYNRKRPIAVQRSEAYWRDWIGFAPDRMPEPPLLALNRVGEAVGYLCYQVNFYRGHQIQEDYAYVTEYGARASSSREAGEIASALLDAALLRALASGKREIHLSAALDADLLGALDGIIDDRQSNTTHSGMARVLHRENLLRSCAMELNARWIAVDRPPGTLRFQTPYGAAQLEATGAFLRVQPVEEAADALPQSTLLGLLFGMLPPEQATENSALHALLRALFPTQEAVYWGADGF
jgi:GNAT superfamily N-acetyltransferase